MSWELDLAGPLTVPAEHARVASLLRGPLFDRVEHERSDPYGRVWRPGDDRAKRDEERAEEDAEPQDPEVDIAKLLERQMFPLETPVDEREKGTSGPRNDSSLLGTYVSVGMPLCHVSLSDMALMCMALHISSVGRRVFFPAVKTENFRRRRIMPTIPPVSIGTSQFNSIGSTQAKCYAVRASLQTGVFMANYSNAYTCGPDPVPGLATFKRIKERRSVTVVRLFLTSICSLTKSILNMKCECDCEDGDRFHVECQEFCAGLERALNRLFVDVCKGPSTQPGEAPTVDDILGDQTRMQGDFMQRVANVFWTKNQDGSMALFDPQLLVRLRQLKPVLPSTSGPAPVVSHVHVRAAGFLGVAFATDTAMFTETPVTQADFIPQMSLKETEDT